MKIEFFTHLTKDNIGIRLLLKLLCNKGSASFNFKKGLVVIQDFSSDKADEILNVISENFEIISLEFNQGSKFKLKNDEKALQNKKSKIREDISRSPRSLVSQVKEYILNEKVFSLSQLRAAFPQANFATLRAYVNDMKGENILVELERGKYALR